MQNNLVDIHQFFIMHEFNLFFLFRIHDNLNHVHSFQGEYSEPCKTSKGMFCENN